MQNFILYNPVKIYFGKGEIAQLKNALPKNKKILLTYGGGSIKKNGVYDQVKAALSNYTIVEFAGIEPNPCYETLMRAAAVIKENNLDFILAVGGGSVIDGTKFIAAAACFPGEPWDILSKQAAIERAIPFGCVLTLPGTGSEMNCGAVISRKNTADKLVFEHPLVFPQFSILDPTTTFSLPANQTANGIADAFIHVTEQYLTYPVDSPLQDRIAEGILSTLIEEAPKVMRNPEDYNARANIMWCATLALNDLIACGVPTDWATHRIGHWLTAGFGLAHAETLAIILPNVLNIKREQKREKLLQYATRVWNIINPDPEEKIDAAIFKTREFFENLRIKTRLSDYKIGEEAITFVVKKLKEHHQTSLGEHEDITIEVSEKIVRESL